DVADHDAALGLRLAGAVADEHVVDLPPPVPRTHVVVEPDLDVGLPGRHGQRDDLLAGTAPALLPVHDGLPGLAAVQADVDVGVLAAQVVEVGLEADDRGLQPAHVDRRADQGGVLPAAGSVGVAVDDREATLTTGEVAPAAVVV